MNIVILLFFCSGATALVYEVIWSKYLTLLLGSTVHAQTIVLAVFMGGLALGNRIFGARADRLRQPLAVYGYLEIGIGLYSFFFPQVYQGADAIFVQLGSPLLGKSGLLLLLKGILSAGLLLGPTILMGGTLPLVAAWLQKNTPDPGRRSARFYSTNSLGAVCGAGLAGFFLVTWMGLPSTLQMTALVNVGIGIIAAGISRFQEAQETSKKTAEVSQANPASAPRSQEVFRSACLVVALTGAVSMGLEVLASRCLCLIFGASLQAFAIVLMAFILGIGLGSAVIASPRRAHWPKEATTLVLMLGAATWIGLLVMNIEGLVELYRQARTGLSRTPMGYRFNQLIAGAFSILVLGLPAAALGAVLPLWIRGVSETSDLLGDRVGRLLTWNTLGAVAGVLVTGFVLMPGVGLRGSFIVLALTLSVAAMLAALWQRRRIATACAAVVGCGLIAASFYGGASWRMVLGSGVFRWRETEIRASIRERCQFMHPVFYEDAADATVSVEETDTAGNRELILKVNGKADASTKGDLSAQLLMAHLPLMMKPDSRDVFVLGIGSGITAGAVLGYPVERLTVAENCGPVLRAAKLFEPWNNGIMTNSRARILREDARTVLKLGATQYDVIIAEPSNPWTVGVGSVFSQEFYQLSASRLKPGGIMAQWFHLYEMNDGIVEMVLRTFSSVFPVMEVWEANSGDIIMLGSSQPWKSDRDTYASIFALERPRKDLESIGLLNPEMIAARQFASQRTASALVGAGPIQSDDFPVLEYNAPVAFFIGIKAGRLFVLDERTWQTELASPQKRLLLESLDLKSLKTIFGLYRSVNRSLQNYVQLGWEGKLCSVIEPVGGGLSLPCIFAFTNCGDIKPPPAASTNHTVRRLFEAEVALRAGSTAEVQALEDIRKTLEEPASRSALSSWSVTYYAGLATKRHLNRNEPEAAKKILLRGLQLEPDSIVLNYLGRILVREGILQLSDLGSGESIPR